MPRYLLLLLLLVPRGSLRGDEVRPKAVAAASPSIARVYVSRSTAYEKAPHWGAAAKKQWLGQLGRFDAKAAAKRVPADAPHRARVLQAIRSHDLSDPRHVPESYASGVVVDRTGLVLVPAHALKGATKVYVRLPGKRGSWADIHAADPRSDLAVLKLLDPPEGLKALPLGDGGKLRRADRVYCLANPYARGARDDEPAYSSGEISRVRHRLLIKNDEVDRARYPLHYFGNLLQTTEAIAPPCSGGALLNRDGEVVGLSCVTAVRGQRRGSYAIPLDTNARRVIEVLKKGEEVEYGFLGVVLSQEDDLGGRGGVGLFRVSPGTPADRAGLRQGDRIVRIDGKAVRHNDDLFLHIGMALAGNRVRIVVARGVREQTIDVTLAKYYVPGTVIAAKQPAARFGLRVDWTSVLFVRIPFPFSNRVPSRGVVIREVVPGSPADKARLQPDKVITEVNGKAVMTPAEYYREMARAGKKVELTFLASDNRSQTITLEEK